MRHFEKLDEQKLKEISKKGGSKKNPKKGTGSLSKDERVRRAREAANARWGNKRKEHSEEEIRKDALDEDD